jgi:tetratricopeptide (TPR) repeat protein
MQQLPRLPSREMCCQTSLMTMQSRPGSMAAGVFGRLALVAADWQDLDAQSGVVNAPIFTVAAPLLDLIRAHAPTPDLSELRDAASDADPRALSMLVRLVALAREAIKQWHPVARQLWRSGEFVEMLESAGPLADLAEAAADVDGILACRIYQARACYRLGLVADAEAAYRLAIANAELLPAPDSKELAVCHDNLGLLLARDARDDEALGHFDRALELDASMPTVVSTRENKAGTLQSLGRYAQAADLHQLNITALGQSTEHTDMLPIVLDNFAQLQLATGEDEAALALLERAAAALRSDDLEARAVNLWIQARANRSLNRLPATAAAFDAAHDLLVSLTRSVLNAEHFRAGFEQASGARAPAASQAWLGWQLGQEASRRGEWTQAQLVFAKASDYAKQRSPTSRSTGPPNANTKAHPKPADSNRWEGAPSQ